MLIESLIAAHLLKVETKETRIRNYFDEFNGRMILLLILGSEEEFGRIFRNRRMVMLQIKRFHQLMIDHMIKGGIINLIEPFDDLW